MIQIHKASAVHPKKKGVAVAVVVVVLKVKGETNCGVRRQGKEKKQKTKTENKCPFLCKSIKKINAGLTHIYVYIFF